MSFSALRHYKSLRQGFSLSRPEKFSVFCVKASIEKVSLEFPPGTAVEGLQSDGKYMMLNCQLLHSAYKSRLQVPSYFTNPQYKNDSPRKHVGNTYTM